MPASGTKRLTVLFGTFVEVGVAAPADAAVADSLTAMRAVERELSFQNARSDLSRLNNGPSGRWIRVSRNTVRVLRLARTMMVSSGGMFDCTVGGELVGRGILPCHAGARRTSGGRAADIEIRRDAVRLLRPLCITLDGIAKGYAVDVGVATLKRRGVASGWINAGGDIRAFGSMTLAISRRELDGSLRALGGLSNSAVATSVVRRRRSVRFPGTIVGSNVRRPQYGIWTVLAARAWRADALTKVAALARPEERNAVLERLGGRLVNVDPGHRQ